LAKGWKIVKAELNLKVFHEIGQNISRRKKGSALESPGWTNTTPLIFLSRDRHAWQSVVRVMSDFKDELDSV
jgi:hypothetical protein